MAAEYKGEIANGSAPTEVRTISKSDNTTLEVEIIGRYSTLENLILSKGPGDDVELLVNAAKGDSFSGYRIKTLACQREGGDVGKLRASLVYAQSTTEPFHITYNIDMQEVQKSLLSHPLFREHPESLQYIQLWNNTSPGTRVKWGSSREKDQFFYYDESSGYSSSLIQITDTNAIKYCKAFVAGIETYNVYLPVVSKISLYLKAPPGLSQDDTTHELSGTLQYSTNIGKWDDGFGFQIQGYDTTSTQGWYKSKDRYVQNADGTWQREEEWVFTNDKTHAWIYMDADAN